MQVKVIRQFIEFEDITDGDIDTRAGQIARTYGGVYGHATDGAIGGIWFDNKPKEIIDIVIKELNAAGYVVTRIDYE
ncbi:MAG: hypothetical protein ACREAE_04145 [Nitrosopumilaceae archaeon]